MGTLWWNIGGTKMNHNPDYWHLKLWQYYPINYNPDEYHKLTSWWLDKVAHIGDKIIEVGCWSALALIWLKMKYPNKDIMGVDVNPAVVHYARTRCYFFQLDIPVYLGDGFNLNGYTDKSKDILFSDGLLEHFSEQLRIEMLKEHLRVAKKVLFLVPTIESYVEGTGYGDENWESKTYWKEFTNKHFNVIDMFEDDGKIGFIIDNIKEEK